MTSEHRRVTLVLRVAQLAALVSGWGAPLYALLEHHWLYGALVFFAIGFVKPRNVRGYIIVCHLLKVAAVVVGVALGLWKIALYGVAVPEFVALACMAIVAPYAAMPRFPHLIRTDWPPKPLELARHETRQRMMGMWSDRLRAAPGDRGVLERVLLDMRWWCLSPEQATILACRAGAPTELVEDLVRHGISWPPLEKPKSIRTRESWGVEVDSTEI